MQTPRVEETKLRDQEDQSNYSSEDRVPGKRENLEIAKGDPQHSTNQ